MAVQTNELTWYAVSKAVIRVGASDPALIVAIDLDAPADTEDEDT
jgi:hypothetical protein